MTAVDLEQSRTGLRGVCTNIFTWCVQQEEEVERQRGERSERSVHDEGEDEPKRMTGHGNTLLGPTTCPRRPSRCKRSMP